MTLIQQNLLALTESVERPIPILSREVASQLTTRQQEILDELTVIFDDGFAQYTMADVAAKVNCSLRTLYTLAGSRDELVLMVVDRNLWRMGRGARRAIQPDMAPLEAIRIYLRAANVAVATITEQFARDCDNMTEAREVNRAHSAYLVRVTCALLDEAVRRGDIARCNTAAVAHVIAGLGRDFSEPDTLIRMRTSPKKAADEMVDVILRGLLRGEQP